MTVAAFSSTTTPTTRVNDPTAADKQHIVLVGGGHGHVQVIKALNHKARPSNVRVTLIDIQASASYSGMVPGCVSRLYTSEETLIHLAPLASWAGTDFVQDAVVDIDPESRTLYLEGRGGAVTSLPFDVVSFDIGSTARGLDEIPGAREYTIPTRPISSLITRIEEAEESLSPLTEGKPIHVVVIGGGAAGIELALGMRARWNPLVGVDSLSVTLLDRGEELLPFESPACRAALHDVLRERGVTVRHSSRVSSLSKEQILLEDGTSLGYTHCVWAAGAGPHDLALQMQKRGIAVNDQGWIMVEPTLQSVSHDCIFAAGDCATIVDLPNGQESPPKAGVYAVRSGPILIENLTRHLGGRSLKDYIPQTDFLKLLMCGDETALGFRFGLPLRGKWVWQLKDTIDRSFMRLFQEESLPPLLEKEKDYDTAQYDAESSSSPRIPLEPKEAAQILARTDDDVDYQVAWNVLRDMMAKDDYKEAVLKEHEGQEERIGATSQ